MVVALDFGDEASSSDELPPSDISQDDRPNPNVNSFSAILACYPVVVQIACYLDRNSLHHLAVTCRQFYANLVQHRAQLVKRTLKCINDDLDISDRIAGGMRESCQSWRVPSWTGQITSGKVSQCARDLVAECRRCGMIVCRNCTAKPPPQPALKGRHRRLCRTCNKAPLYAHGRGFGAHHVEPGTAFTSDSFSRGPCMCADTVYLCISCGSSLKSADTTYIRAWTWRSRYSTYLDGMGTGIGEGNEGVECGKGDLCLAAREVEKEIECDAEELAVLKREMEQAEKDGHAWSGTSYQAQEMEGIGGVVKKKVKKRVKVGQVVKEYEDERDTGQYLVREQDGINRSWCFWCQRIIPGIKDGMPGLALTSSSSSSLA